MNPPTTFPGIGSPWVGEWARTQDFLRDRVTTATETPIATTTSTATRMAPPKLNDDGGAEDGTAVKLMTSLTDVVPLSVNDPELGEGVNALLVDPMVK
jgi:hypothetical protein